MQLVLYCSAPAQLARAKLLFLILTGCWRDLSCSAQLIGRLFSCCLTILAESIRFCMDFVKLGNSGFEHKILDGVLWVRSASAMLGYLNAPSPFDADGWFNTQDLVERDGEYIRILGRKSELINVGGEKVHPTEVENVLLQIDNVKDVTVRGQPNPITGEVVAAKITPLGPEDPDTLKRRVRQFCHARLERYKIPAVIEVVLEDHYGARFKKSRDQTSIRRPADTDAGS